MSDHHPEKNVTQQHFQVAEKERAQRLLEIYNRMDARSHVVHEGKKFKKSDILQVIFSSISIW